MKPLLLTIPILIALTVLQPLVIRHVDPSLVPESNPDAIALAKLYISYSSHLSSFNISLAKAILSNASMAYIPERLRIAYQRMNELLKSFTDSVNNTKILLDIAEALYMKGDYNASLAVLNNVNTSLRAVEARYYEIETAINVLYSLGLPANVLKQILSNLNSTLNSLKTRHIELLNKLRKAINTSIGTLLTIDVSREEVFYGESLGVYGRLVSEHGYGIANKTINIYLGPEIYKAVTNGSGHFGTSIPVTIYQSPVRVYAEFLSDGVYRYSRSRDIYIRVIFFKPNISAWIDNSTYLPGRSISLHVHAGKGLEVVVRGPFGFNANFISNGSVYNFSIPIPPLAREGIYIINVFSLPRGIIGPGSVSLAVNVTRLMPSVRINAPSYLITGLTYTISVFPSVESYIEVYTSPGIATLARGYEISLSVPHTYLGRSVRVLLHVSPLDPGYRSVDLELELPVYNILIIFSLGVMVLLTIIIVFPRPSHIPHYVVRGVQQTRAGEVHEEGLKGLFKSLIDMLKMVTGIEFKPSYTIREYLNIVRERVSRALWMLIRSFMMKLEMLLYSRLENEKILIERIIKEFISSLGGRG